MNGILNVDNQRAVWPGLFLVCCLSLLTIATSQKLLAQTPNGVTVAGNVLSSGSLPNQLRFPFSVFLDGSGFMYVADYGNNRIQKFPPNSTTATSGSTVAGGQNGTAANQFQQPVSVFVDGAGFIYVADRNNNRIQKFPPNSTSATNGSTVAGGNGIGSTATKLKIRIVCLWMVPDLSMWPIKITTESRSSRPILPQPPVAARWPEEMGKEVRPISLATQAGCLSMAQEIST